MLRIVVPGAIFIASLGCTDFRVVMVDDGQTPPGDAGAPGADADRPRPDGDVVRPPPGACALISQTVVSTDIDCSDPTIAVDGTGRPHIAWAATGGRHAVGGETWSIEEDAFGPGVRKISLATRADGSPVALVEAYEGTSSDLFVWGPPSSVTRARLPGPVHPARWLASSRAIAVRPDGDIETLTGYWDETRPAFEAQRGVERASGFLWGLSPEEVVRSADDDTWDNTWAHDLLIGPDGFPRMLYSHDGNSWIATPDGAPERLPLEWGANQLAVAPDGVLTVMGGVERELLTATRRGDGDWSVEILASGRSWYETCPAAPGAGDRCSVDVTNIGSDAAIASRSSGAPVVVAVAVEERGELTWTCGGDRVCDLEPCCSWSPQPTERFALVAAPLGSPPAEVAPLDRPGTLPDGTTAEARVGLAVAGASDGTVHVAVVERTRSSDPACQVTHLVLACD